MHLQVFYFWRATKLRLYALLKGKDGRAETMASGYCTHLEEIILGLLDQLKNRT